MAGIQQTQARRSQLLERLLKQRPQPSIESPEQLIAELGAQFIRQKKAKKLQAEEEAEQKKTEANLIAALTGRQPDSSITLEGIGDDPDEEILSPGRKVGIERAVAQLPPDQQVQALQILGMRKDVSSQPPDKISTKQFREGDSYVTRQVINGVPGREISRSKIDRIQTVRTGPILDEKRINTEAVKSANASAALRRDLTATLPEIAANKRSVGIRGKIGISLGGLGTNILGQEFGDAVARAIAGNDQEKLVQIQTRLTTLRSKLRPIVTGEAGARQSETERQIASKAIGFIDQIQGPSDLSKAFPLVIGALKELTVATLENEFEQARASDAVDFPFDLSNKEGFIKLGEMLSTAGFTLEEATRARDRLIRIQNL